MRKLSQFHNDCILIDDVQISPAEIVILTESCEKLLAAFGVSCRVFQVEEDSVKRVVRVVSPAVLGITRWMKGLRDRSVRGTAGIPTLQQEDLYALSLYYAFVYAGRDSWLKANCIRMVQMRVGLRDEAEAREWLRAYADRNGYRISRLHIDSLYHNPALLQNVSAEVSLLARRVRRMATNKYIGYREWMGRKSREKKYLRLLAEQGILKDEWILLNAAEHTGRTGCTLLRVEKADGAAFVKGNELSLFCGIRNEIAAQNVLLSAGESEWFLPMTEHDEQGRWIMYPFVAWDTLREYLKKRKLDPDEVHRLGDFFLEALKGLANAGIVHGDLRPENIMVKVGDDEKIDGFLIIDYGGASLQGPLEWQESGYIGKFIANNLCGNYRYDEIIVDDAAAAYLIYTEAGGEATDGWAGQIYERIGKLYCYIK